MHGTMGKSLRHSEKPRSFHPESVEDEQGWLGTQSIVASPSIKKLDSDRRHATLAPD
jgi:hypothetical protein